jgi:hypothetical protein
VFFAFTEWAYNPIKPSQVYEVIMRRVFIGKMDYGLL